MTSTQGTLDRIQNHLGWTQKNLIKHEVHLALAEDGIDAARHAMEGAAALHDLFSGEMHYGLFAEVAMSPKSLDMETLRQALLGASMNSDDVLVTKEIKIDVEYKKTKFLSTVGVWMRTRSLRIAS